MTEASKADDKPIKADIEPCIKCEDKDKRHEQDNNIIKGYMEKITRQEVELKYCNMVIEQAQVTITNLKLELGR